MIKPDLILCVLSFGVGGPTFWDHARATRIFCGNFTPKMGFNAREGTAFARPLQADFHLPRPGCSRKGAWLEWATASTTSRGCSSGN